jgi:hypothetical protein
MSIDLTITANAFESFDAKRAFIGGEIVAFEREGTARAATGGTDML